MRVEPHTNAKAVEPQATKPVNTTCMFDVYVPPSASVVGQSRRAELTVVNSLTLALFDDHGLGR